MAVANNSSDEAVVSLMKLWTGVFPFHVVAVNPTLEELKAFGVNLQKEPEYKVTINDQEFNKIVFWVKSATEEEILTKYEILVRPVVRSSKDGSKFQWVNNIGQTAWTADLPTYSWWKNPDKTRKAYIGEESLVEFTKAWANVATGGEVSFDTIDKIVNGDVKELREYVKILKNNTLRLLLGVKSDKYQTVYGRHFGRVKPQRDDLFIKALNEDYGAFDAEYNNSLQPREYVPTLTTPDSNAGGEGKPVEGEAPTAALWGGAVDAAEATADAQPAAAASDDIPF